jgi:hypothetical protein
MPQHIGLYLIALIILRYSNEFVRRILSVYSFETWYFYGKELQPTARTQAEGLLPVIGSSQQLTELCVHWSLSKFRYNFKIHLSELWVCKPETLQKNCYGVLISSTNIPR